MNWKRGAALKSERSEEKERQKEERKPRQKRETGHITAKSGRYTLPHELLFTAKPTLLITVHAINQCRIAYIARMTTTRTSYWQTSPCTSAQLIAIIRPSTPSQDKPSTKIRKLKLSHKEPAKASMHNRYKPSQEIAGRDEGHARCKVMDVQSRKKCRRLAPPQEQIIRVCGGSADAELRVIR